MILNNKISSKKIFCFAFQIFLVYGFFVSTSDGKWIKSLELIVLYLSGAAFYLVLLSILVDFHNKNFAKDEVKEAIVTGKEFDINTMNEKIKKVESGKYRFKKIMLLIATIGTPFAFVKIIEYFSYKSTVIMPSLDSLGFKIIATGTLISIIGSIIILKTGLYKKRIDVDWKNKKIDIQ